MWNEDYRTRIWSQLDQEWDLIIIGGGITGAGILREATLHGQRALLVEARDFSFGTSSRSSKLVHGGFRYLRNRQFGVTHESVREREWLLKEARHLVTELPFIFPRYNTQHTPNWQLQVGVMIYDLMAPKWNHCKYSPAQLMEQCPQIKSEGLLGGYQFYDAKMDDSRLVLRVLREAYALGGVALNYARARQLLRSRGGTVCGIVLEDTSTSKRPAVEVRAKVVINAAGPWSDEVRSHVGAPPHLRKLRGSHLVFPYALYPLHQAVTILHPRDNRTMFAIPWEGTTIFGTTDLDHLPEMDQGEPYATSAEIDYILEAVQANFPRVKAGRDQILSTFAGLRPIINTGKANPSKESRAHAVLDENGLVTITGGKLTTFRIMAQEALQHAAPRLPGQPKFKSRLRLFNSLPRELPKAALTHGQAVYLLGRYGEETVDLLASVRQEEMAPIESLPNVWAELRWAARNEAVVHLDDLLLRRVRLGLLLPNGGMGQMERIRRTVQAELGWDDRRWKQEIADYQRNWQRFYSPSPQG
jgi:glycerol-3-phosphate dehydrogenase